jgi:serine/threonine protein kinase
LANRQIRAQQLFRYLNFHVNKSQPLGHGSYGAVYKAKCDQLPCAAKVLHPTILDPNDPGAGRIMQRFQQECAFLESIRHPNIVQYLGMTRDPESRLPVLLMELLDESLTKMLERSQQSLAYCVQVDICHDIALAVAYLHSNDIIHRDLSSNNVLIMAKSRAKVTDFGMSKLAGAAPSMTPLTMYPGTVAYMPPEALDEPPVYTKKLDCFSEGVIMIQVCTQLWPEPGPRTKTVQDPRSPTGRMQMPVLEPERRRNHIELIDQNHGLLSIANDCLHYQENERPSSEELCQRLAGLKITREYRESVEQVERVQNDIAQLERQMGEKKIREAATLLQLQELREESQQQQQRYESEIQSKDGQIRTLNKQLSDYAGTIDRLRDEFQQECHKYWSEIPTKDRKI